MSEVDKKFDYISGQLTVLNSILAISVVSPSEGHDKERLKKLIMKISECPIDENETAMFKEGHAYQMQNFVETFWDVHNLE